MLNTHTLTHICQHVHMVERGVKSHLFIINERVWNKWEKVFAALSSEEKEKLNKQKRY